MRGLLCQTCNIGLGSFQDNPFIAGNAFDYLRRWYEFITSSPSPTLAQSGEVGAPGAASYFPSIDISPNGNIGMNFLESSASEYVSMYVSGRSVSDPAGTMEATRLAVAGTGASYTRVGDYSGISLDPSASGTFWAGNEYAPAGKNLTEKHRCPARADSAAPSHS